MFENPIPATIYKGSAGISSYLLAVLAPPKSYAEILGCIVAGLTIWSLSLDIRRKLLEIREKATGKKKSRS